MSVISYWSSAVALVMGKGEDIVWSGTLYQPPVAGQASVLVPADISLYSGILVTVRNPDGSTLFTAPGTVVNGLLGQYTWPTTNANTVNAVAGLRTFDVWRTDAGSQREMAVGTLMINATPRNP